MKKSRIKTYRLLGMLAIIALMCLGLAFHSATGSPSSFGIGEFFLLCPLGGLEVLLSSKTFIPQALISLVVVLIICLLVGRAWCAWACPVTLVKQAFGRKHLRPDEAQSHASLTETLAKDTRTWVLLGVLVAALIVGFPVFCLICPVGLTFGTIVSIWQAIQFGSVSWGLAVFPLALAIEIFLLKKWCLNLCPIAGLLSLIGRFSKTLRPQVDSSTCLHANGKSCHACFDVCPETIDLHALDSSTQLTNCTRCAECRAVCPTQSIAIPFFSGERKAITMAEANTNSEVSDD